MDHEISPGEVNLNASLSFSDEPSTLPYVEEPEEPTSDRTTIEHFDDMASSIAMIGLTFSAIGKAAEAEGVGFVLDFLAWYSVEHNLRSEVGEGLVQAANMRRAGQEHLTSAERMGADHETVEALFTAVEQVRNTD